MKSEKAKMLRGALFNPLDPQLSRERQRCRQLCKRFNDSREDEQEGRRILAELLGYPSDAWIEPPFFCDYGYNIALGTKVFFNFNCVVLDVVRVEIGSNVLFGLRCTSIPPPIPSVQPSGAPCKSSPSLFPSAPTFGSGAEPSFVRV
jgi:acetyltransferase-like isoleucine patch superfamily enzyme